MCIRDRVSTQSTGGCGTSGMAGIFHISRGGTRGKGDFSWDSVKNDEERENYLGHSLNAPVGRWQRGKDLQWWTKNKDGGDKDAIKAQRAAEMKRIQMEEQVMMEEAMGMRPRRERHQIEMEAHELREVLKRGQVAEEQREFYNNADLSLIHISEPTRLLSISYAVFCLKKKKKKPKYKEKMTSNKVNNKKQ
eukprot:TRINITY_DN12190_c0_g2_i1.p1 TRINITY_DN12190_c0_g2~~TRINITY_DN12190_c0_g2_i1.p1  ORF type:complete len:192 (+),score=68.42 TRINITY_DN12190_c0_g2_i1:179-754(+)